MQRNAYRWDHIVVELQIKDKVVESRMITFSAYQRIYKLFKTRALAQKKEWSIYLRYQRNYKTIRNNKLFDIINSESTHFNYENI